MVAWQALVVAALLSLALAAVPYEGLFGQRSTVSPAVRSHGLSQNGLMSLPLAAQGPVSLALGADSLAYRVSASNGGFAAASPAQRLSLRFGRSGVSVSSGTTHVGLSLSAVGYGSSLNALDQVAPRVRANRVLYERAGLSEWYANGPLGLEQAFAISRAPSGHPAGPLTLSIALSGDVHASLASDGQAITLSHTGKTALRYTGLSATDARGRTLHSWLQLQAGRVLLRVDAQEARYPLRIDPFVQQGEKLTGASGEIGAGEFSFGAALSSDGNTAVIGAPGDSGGVGAAWVFTRSGSTWTQQGGKLTGSGESGGGRFGQWVALSSDGNTALIGGPYDHGEVGAAWVFTRSGSTWTQQGGKLTGSGESGGGRLGWTVALSSSGNTALIGGYLDNGGNGAAWVFTRSGETWTQQGAKLTGEGEVGKGWFGNTALSSDGNTALITGDQDNGGKGAAWVFTRSGETWTQQGSKLTGSGEVGEGRFGTSFALSSNGNTALIGGWGDNGNKGAAWVFTRSGSTWTQQGSKLAGEGEVGAGFFGDDAALSSDGNTALITGSQDNSGKGATWVFTRSGETWTQQGSKLTGSGEVGAGEFGAGLWLSADGTTALIGGRGDNGSIGAAWVFTRSGETWTQQGEKLTAGSGEIGEGYFGAYKVALSSDGNTALIGSQYDNPSQPPPCCREDATGAAWVFTRSGSTWTQQGSKLTGGAEESGKGEFGDSVALSSDGNTALIGGWEDGGGVGAAWVFTRSGSAWTQQGKKLTGSGGSGQPRFGLSVALSSDGNTALIGGWDDNGSVGAAWVFTRSGSTWTQQGEKFTGSGAVSRGQFGDSVALSSDGNTALIGNWEETPGGPGSAWVFTRSGSTWTQQGPKLTGSGEVGAGVFGDSVALSSDGNTALIGGNTDNGGKGAAWVFTRSGSTWTQQGAKLMGGGGVGEGYFGSGVALSSDGNTALIGGDGWAWVFTRSGSTWTQLGEKFTGSGQVGESAFGARVALSSDGKTALIAGPYDNGHVGAAWVFVQSVSPTQISTSLSGAGKAGATITVAEGTAVSDSATLSGENASSATGKVSYKVYSDKECKTLVASAGEVSVAGELVPASSALALAPGTYYWQASYGGDANNGSSNSKCGSEVETVEAPPKPKPTQLSTSLSGGGQSGEKIAVREKTAVTDKATLSGEHVALATGKVSYKVYSDKECKTLVASAGEVSVAGELVPASSALALAPGTYYWQASYGGDALNQASQSTCGSEVETVERASQPKVPPVNTAPPTIKGKDRVKSRLTASSGRWTGTAPITYSYQWESCGKNGKKCQAIRGATKTSLTLGRKYARHRLKVRVTAANAAGKATSTSRATDVIRR
jgi:hypothetical protein